MKIRSYSFIVLLIFVLSLSACTEEISLLATPDWIVEYWDLIETNEPGLFESRKFSNLNPDQGPSIQIVFKQYHFRDIPILRSYHQVDFEFRRNNPELYATVLITQERAIEKAIAFIQSDINSTFRISDIDFINTSLNDLGWDIAFYKANYESEFIVEHNLLVDSTNGDIILIDWKPTFSFE